MCVMFVCVLVDRQAASREVEGRVWVGFWLLSVAQMAWLWNGVGGWQREAGRGEGERDREGESGIYREKETCGFSLFHMCAVISSPLLLSCVPIAAQSVAHCLSSSSNSSF